MATPVQNLLGFLPTVSELGDATLRSDLEEIVKTGQLGRVKQALSSYRRKRTSAHNAVKETRRMLIEEPVEEGVPALSPAERAESEHTLAKQSHLWTDFNKVCRSLEKVEEALEFAAVFEDKGQEGLTDDEGAGWVTPSSSPQKSPRHSLGISPLEECVPSSATAGAGQNIVPSRVKSESAGIPSGAEHAFTGKAANTQTVAKVDLPKLKDTFSLVHHLRVCENMLVEAEVGYMLNGEFVPLPRLRYNVVTKILGTLQSHKKVFDLGTDRAEQTDHDWRAVKKALLGTHAKQESLVAEFRTSLLRMKYSTVDDFSADSRRLYSMAGRLFGWDNTYEMRGLVESLVGKLPTERASALIAEVHRIANLGAYSPDWPVALEFDDADDSLLGILSRLERQEGAVRSLKAVSRHDSARAAELVEEAEGMAAMEAANSPPKSARTWCAQYPEESLIKVCECWGDMLKVKVPEMVGSFALKTRYRRNPVFRIVALREGCERVEIVDRLKSQGVKAEVFTPFQ